MVRYQLHHDFEGDDESTDYSDERMNGIATTVHGLFGCDTSVASRFIGTRSPSCRHISSHVSCEVSERTLFENQRNGRGFNGCVPRTRRATPSFQLAHCTRDCPIHRISVSEARRKYSCVSLFLVGIFFLTCIVALREQRADR